MASSTQIVRELRRGILTAICEAQEAPAPRSRLMRMCYSLLWHALAALDCESGLTAPYTIRIAVHALVEWRRHQAPSALAMTAHG